MQQHPSPWLKSERMRPGLTVKPMERGFRFRELKKGAGMSAPGTVERRLSKVEQRVDDHEKRCAERMAEIRDGGAEMKEAIRSMNTELKQRDKVHFRTLLAILLAILGFLGKEVWASRGGAAVGAAVAITATGARQ